MWRNLAPRKILPCPKINFWPPVFFSELRQAHPLAVSVANPKNITSDKKNSEMKKILKLFLPLFLFYFNTSTLSAQDIECACCKLEFQQFSFWEGDWEVFGYDGTKQGTNKIVFLQDRCVLQENWSGLTKNDAGTSYNFYNTEKKQWQQVWISNKGYVLELKGNYFDSTMVLKSELVKDFNGNYVINRVTWTKQSNGDVKQVWQVSSDNEKTWTIQFYGIYKRKNAKKE
jgi:hypothetical protein